MVDRMRDGDTQVNANKGGREPTPPDADGVHDPFVAAHSDDSPSDEPAGISSSQPAAVSTLEDEPPVPGAATRSSRRGDRIFLALTTGSPLFAVALVLLVAIFLLVKAIPAIADNTGNFFGTQWLVSGTSTDFGISGYLYTTVLSSVIALIVAVPISIGIALFITQYASARVARPVAYAIDVLAAIPSIIYGVWGAKILAPQLESVQRALSHIGLGFFADEGFTQGTVFDAAVVLVVMIIPIITAISRDVFARTPSANKEAALALGATKWEMVRIAVLPYGRPGVISGAMLGLGRALGETIAVLLILSPSTFGVSIFNGGQTIAGKIAGSSAEFGANPGPFIALGLVLFVLTFIVNGAARAIVNRRKDFV